MQPTARGFRLQWLLDPHMLEGQFGAFLALCDSLAVKPK